MSENHRIDSGLRRLVDYYISPADDDEEHHPSFPDLFRHARSILDENRVPDVVEDTQFMGDMIRRKLIEEDATPDRAAKFTALFNRLLPHRVLKQQWGILKLLDILSEDARPPPPPAPPSVVDAETAEQTLKTAFQHHGLHRLPVREPQSNEATATTETQNRTVLPDRGTRWEPSEEAILLSLPYTLLGVASACIPVEVAGKVATSVSEKEKETKASAQKKYQFRIPQTLPLPVVALLHALAEPALLYKELEEYCRDSEGSVASGGLVGQSLKSAIGAELTGYVNLVGALESEIRRAAAACSGGGSRAAHVTLKRCVVWTREATMGLRLMSLIVDKTKDQKGGQLVSTIHSFASSHGDPFIYSFAERLLTQITRPFYEMLRHWIYDGELTDPYHEFFVTESTPDPHSSAPTKSPSSSVWQDKYTFTPAQIPTIISPSFANRIFLIGKSLNFIRHGCSDAEWVSSYSRTTSKPLSYGDTARLEMNIDEAYHTTMARLIHLMDAKFKLFSHLRALKAFLLLGQGDFIALLMESLSTSLDRPAGALYRHNLTAQLEHAIRGSNAQFDDPEMLSRLDARMLEMSHGEVGWDVFTLEYKVDAPVDVVITPHASRQYLKIFNFLWRIKRVEFALGSTWRRFMTGARGVLRAVDHIVGEQWKQTRCVVAEMVHFVNQLQYYILFEVIESSWTRLQAAINKPNVTLDDLITAHTDYLTNITQKGLLSSAANKASKKRTSSDVESDTFLTQLHSILKVMLQYRSAVDGLYSFSVAAYTRQQEAATLAATRTAAGQWGQEDGDNKQSEEDRETLERLKERLSTLKAEFWGKTVVLLGDLAYQPDTDLRLLGVLLGFNEFYPVGRKRRTGGEVGRSGSGMGERGSGRGASGRGEGGGERERIGSGASGNGRGSFT